jgi:hypothetical protein
MKEGNLEPAGPPEGRGGRALAARLGRIGIAAAVLALLFTRVPVDGVLGILAEADVLPASAAFLIALLIQWIVALRLRIPANLQRMGLTTAETFELNLASRFYALFIPGGNLTAIAIRVMRLARLRRHYAGAMMAVAFDRVVATITLCATGIGFWIVARPPQSTVWLLLMIGTLLGLTLPVAALHTLRIPEAAAGPGGLVRVLGRRLAPLQLAVAQAREMSARQFLAVVALSLAAHLLGVVGFFLLAAAVSLELGLASIGWIQALLMLAGLVPVSVSGLGIREGVALLALPALGIGAELAVAFSLLVFSVTVLGVGLFGGVLEAWRYFAPREG